METKKFKVFLQYEKVEEVEATDMQDAIEIARRKQRITGNERFVTASAEEFGAEKTVKIQPLKPWFNGKDSKELNGLLSNIPGNYLSYTKCLDICSVLTDYAKICEKLKEPN